MKVIEKFLSNQINKFGRESFLNIVIENHNFPQKKWFLQKITRISLKLLSSKDLFSLVYRKNLWGEIQSVSGPGSILEATINIRAALPKLFKKYNIKIVLDIPCGDFNWMKYVKMNGIHYIGADIVDDLIQRNIDEFNSNNRSFKVLNLIKDRLPKADLILCRDGLVHLSEKEIFKAVNNIKRSGSKYLLTTSFTEKESNLKIGVSHWRPLNFQKPPYNFPSPLLTIRENEETMCYQDKSLCLWQIQDL